MNLWSRAALAACLVALPSSAHAGPDDYLLPHPDAWWWASGQLNVVGQAHPAFTSPYQGDHSLHGAAEGAVSVVATVFGAARLGRTTEILIDGEAAGGGGISDALGVAGFTNLDVVRNPTLGVAPYLARAELHQIVPLSSKWVDVERGPFRAFARLPARRLELRAGKLSTVDLFDVNDVGSDSHRQFLDWAIDNDGAYDYAADTRGYTLGAEVEYQEPRWGARFGEMLMPTVANGIDYDFDLAHARGEQLEGEWRDRLGGRPGVVRALVFWNHAKMGNYADANAAARAAHTAPVIESTRVAGRTKVGVGLGVEQEVADGVTAFGRFGWNDGANESFAYTEIDDTVEVGAAATGARWHRPGDQVGVALVSNGLSRDHRAYLALGGEGFILGDGRLRYGRETIGEAYYTARAWHGVFPAIDVQVIARPGYNVDRGPALVGSARIHVDF